MSVPVQLILESGKSATDSSERPSRGLQQRVTTLVLYKYLLDAGFAGLGYYGFKNKTTPHFSAYQCYTVLNSFL
jgi:hypothetical protein